MSFVVGVDPSSHRHGIAIYRAGKLEELTTWMLVDVIGWLEKQEIKPRFSIENVMANNFVYSRNNQKTKQAQAKVGLSIGRCQQSQVELMRVLDHLEIPYQLIKPTRDNWAKDKARFERYTGWTGRSNEDTRSASYFGFLATRG